MNRQPVSLNQSKGKAAYPFINLEPILMVMDELSKALDFYTLFDTHNPDSGSSCETITVVQPYDSNIFLRLLNKLIDF